MNKTIRGVAMVVVFCITWWIVAGEAMQAVEPAKQAYKQAVQKKQTYQSVVEAKEKAEQALLQAYEQAENQAYAQAKEQAYQAEQAEQAYEKTRQSAQQAEQASIAADAHWRTQASWGIGAGLLADVLLLVGALAWSKLTAKA